jgi:hypothetical protein
MMKSAAPGWLTKTVTGEGSKFFFNPTYYPWFP